MKGVGIRGYGPAREGGKLMDADLPKPAQPTGFDIVVKVHAVALNPIDWKVRAGYFDNPTTKFEAEPKVC